MKPARTVSPMSTMPPWRFNARAWLLQGLLGLLLGLHPGAAAQAQAPLAARVNGAGISLELLDRQFEDLLRDRNIHIARLQDPARAKGLKREALDHLIRIELLWQQARAAALVASDDEVERAVAQAQARFRSAESFERRIAQGGFSPAGYREHTRKLMSGDRYAQRIVDREVQVSDADVAEFYAANPRLFHRKEQVRVRQIRVAVPADATPAAREQARRRIEEVLGRARAGERFEALARQHSDDPTRQWGGETDPFGRGEKPRAVEAAAFALAPGALSDVIETDAAFYLVELQQHLPALSVPLADVRQRIHVHLRDSLGKEAVERAVEQLRAQGRVELLTPL
jgi:parvulin-like peptidyl-prolyl isomerase